MIPRRPYILRGLYDWLIDNELTPHLVVDATWPHVRVPLDYVHDDQIVLNVAPTAVQAFMMDNDGVRFRARFGGQDQKIDLPIGSIMAIYARENGAGMIFEPEEGIDFPAQDDESENFTGENASELNNERELWAVSDEGSDAPHDEVQEEPASDMEGDSEQATSGDQRPVRGKPMLRVVRND